jgi:uncharacterized protein
MPSKLVHAHATVPLRSGAAVRLAVIADTHSQPHVDTRRHVAALAPDAILHAGDIGDLTVLREFSAIAPLHAVRGNIDVRAPGLSDTLILDLVADLEKPATRVLRLLLIHIAVTGARLRADVARLAARHGAALVICGHSHVPFIGRDRGLAVFNPGSVGPRRFHLPIVFGILTLREGRVEMAHMDCETGRGWSPP